MTIRELLEEKNMSIYKLSKISSVPYATCNDIVNGKTQLEKCTAETVYKIAQALNISVELLLAPCCVKRSSSENFKSTICHKLKELGDIDFIIDTLESQDIRIYFERKWYPEALYLLAMLDYISKENDVTLCNEYDDIRMCKLEKPIYPSSIVATSIVLKDKDILKRAEETAIDEFKRFNIIENDIRNVV